jgi:hypothetical protein
MLAAGRNSSHAQPRAGATAGAGLWNKQSSRPEKRLNESQVKYVPLGLCNFEAFAHALFEATLGMEQSTTYQGILRRGREEGRIEEARRLVLLLGELKFGAPDDATRSVIEALDDVARLEELGVRLLNANSWPEVLAPQTPRRRNGRRRSS